VVVSHALAAEEIFQFRPQRFVLGGVFGPELFEIEKLPAHGRQGLRLRQVDGDEIRRAIMQAQQELPRRVVKTVADISDQLVAGVGKLIEGNWDGSSCR
jgi:hypothetical protein